MTELLIRREVTADRGKVFLSTHDVLVCIQALPQEAFTTREVALAIAQSNPRLPLGQLEHSVRRAIAWLLKRGYVIQAKGNPERARRRAPNWGMRYEAVEVMGPCDCALLNKIFMHA